MISRELIRIWPLADISYKRDRCCAGQSEGVHNMLAHVFRPFTGKSAHPIHIFLPYFHRIIHRAPAPDMLGHFRGNDGLHLVDDAGDTLRGEGRIQLVGEAVDELNAEIRILN